MAPGEVLALVGENGAGKSTLIQVACGLYTPDAGEVRVRGQVLRAGDPRAAIDAGVGVVYQHFMLVGPLPVWENVVLGREPRKAGLWGALGVVDRDRARAEVAEAAQKAGLALDIDAPVESLGVGAQQRVEIVKQLWRGAQVLILDEPTAVLGPAEADELARTVKKLAAEGRSIVFISHKLPEVLRVADRIAVLRRGKLVLERAAAGAEASRLAEAIMGVGEGKAAPLQHEVAAQALGLAQTPLAPSASSTSAGPSGASNANVRLVAKDLRCQSARGRPALRGLSFTLRPGEVLGIAGVDGNGQGELAEVLTGLRAATGSLTLEGKEGLAGRGWAHDPHRARESGVVHLPEDRHKRAMCLPLSLAENASLGHHALTPWAKGPRGWLVDRRGRQQRTESLIVDFDVRPTNPLATASGLSGGNQQKLVVARELAGGPVPKLVVAVQPTRGLDFLATQRVWKALRAARDAGASVIVASLDLDELRALSDRILVMFDGRATGEAPPTASDEELGKLMLGQSGTEQAHA
ncbi:MAG: ABC transporter ATP-binding protein [Deltaproteobacteria bacterium]|nr:ABC transporter ATP-binding protein [Deltaproteobacteria bacterium]